MVTSCAVPYVPPGRWATVAGAVPSRVIPDEAEDGVLVPTAFTAYTWNVYVVPLVKPVIAMGETVEVAIILPGVEEAR